MRTDMDGTTLYQQNLFASLRSVSLEMRSFSTSGKQSYRQRARAFLEFSYFVVSIDRGERILLSFITLTTGLEFLVTIVARA